MEKLCWCFIYATWVAAVAGVFFASLAMSQALSWIFQ
jgi:hypothetical protein